VRLTLIGFFIVCIVPTLTNAQPTTVPSTMKAIRAHEHGGPDVLRYEDAPVPKPGAGELLVQVYAAGVNPVDWKMVRAGGGRGRGGQLPMIPGYDLAGVVRAGGDGAGFAPGDEVFAFADLGRGGAYAEYAIVRTSEAATKPKSVDFVHAAATPLAALTAWQALFDTAKLDKGQTVLIHAGAGGVGSFAVQLARWKGATVIATASKENLDFLKQLGADQAVDYRNERFEDAAKNVDVILDPVGGETQARSWACLKKGGILVSIVSRPSADEAEKHGVRAAGILVKPDASELKQIADLVDSGNVKPQVGQTFPLADAAKAFEQSQTGHARGKIVLTVVPPAPSPAPAPANEFRPHR
jgi:NADPH:quinone reductase-like Zn-dependent oxidoreductase